MTGIIDDPITILAAALITGEEVTEEIIDALGRQAIVRTHGLNQAIATCRAADLARGRHNRTVILVVIDDGLNHHIRQDIAPLAAGLEIDRGHQMAVGDTSRAILGSARGRVLLRDVASIDRGGGAVAGRPLEVRSLLSEEDTRHPEVAPGIAVDARRRYHLGRIVREVILDPEAEAEAVREILGVGAGAGAGAGAKAETRTTRAVVDAIHRPFRLNGANMWSPDSRSSPVIIYVVGNENLSNLSLS